MGATVKAEFQIASWDEVPFDEQPGTTKVTRSTVTKTFTGDIVGESTLEYLMAYADDGTATFVGLERVRGSVAGLDGSFVLQHVGTFADGAARATLTAVPGSGTGDLRHVAGSGDFLADPAGKVALDLTFTAETA